MTTPNTHQRDRAGRTPLHYAAGDGKLDAVTALIAAGAEIDAREDTGQNTPLMFAAQRDDNIDVITALVEAGADVNLTNNKGETPLFIATRSYGTSGIGAAILRYLLDHGADPHIKAADGDTVIDYVKFVNDKPGRRAAFGSLLDD
ncbi:ankyrin repeat domain-containing protein [Mycolicibacterium sp. lyk4-40-TYG-92]|uniref:ankyrin repeat domain-containing protein n=1 Tax=Mycolicibacterium sp. lyk4-40-TYG-92 TaxID=3040295 RepID=UPI00254B5FE3|nr:ankyrin repeat domain-containing protein [Mycolicibacterium sp. lyk4-40-TYG-92]